MHDCCCLLIKHRPITKSYLLTMTQTVLAYPLEGEVGWLGASGFGERHMIHIYFVHRDIQPQKGDPPAPPEGALLWERGGGPPEP